MNLTRSRSTEESRGATAGAGGTDPGHSLTLRSISHYFGHLRAVDDVSIEIEAGEFVSLLGPSGCGKTTLLRIIAGFTTPSEGDVLVDGRSVVSVPAHKRGIGIVFQSYGLFPHMTCERNVSYGLEAQGMSRREARQVVAEKLEAVRLQDHAKHYPRELSGGQQQRVALARALAVQPRILLLDEPLSALDKNLRLDMQIEIKRIQRTYGITTIMVSHDQEEAMSMADRIAVLNKGQLQQLATPAEIYDSPDNLFVNRFVGTVNSLRGTLESRDSGRCRVRLDEGATCDFDVATDVEAGQRVTVGIRPENFRFAESGDEAHLEGRIEMVLPLGPTTVFEVGLLDGPSIKVAIPRSYDSKTYMPQDRVSLVVTNQHLIRMFRDREEP